MSTSICDFCSEPNVVWRYPAQNFVAYAVAGVVGQSLGDWAACTVCHALIEDGDRGDVRWVGEQERSHPAAVVEQEPISVVGAGHNIDRLIGDGAADNWELKTRAAAQVGIHSNRWRNRLRCRRWGG